ncbi:hypothetical protein ACEWY4_007799 [Coilia grayii]|uniref:Gypsy retrotransposon integrase-like protein 1 n=1 Tax=Coilia grayii TaxID=363190 RepID=A0ABD1K940_9TELE
MRESLRAELRQELTEQVSLLSKSIVQELQERLRIPMILLNSHGVHPRVVPAANAWGLPLLVSHSTSGIPREEPYAVTAGKWGISRGFVRGGVPPSRVFGTPGHSRASERGGALNRTPAKALDEKAWDAAFAASACQMEVQGVARLLHQPPVQLPPATETIVWAQVHKLLPQRQPLATVTQLDPKKVQGRSRLVLRSTGPQVIEVDVQQVEQVSSTEHPALALRGEGLTGDQQTQLTTLLQKWSHVFAAHDEDFGGTHQIPTGTAHPIRERYRPVPPNLYPELRALLQGMLDSGVVKESASPWAAPVVLAKKKDGSWRFCVDYRKLNAVTHKDSFPLPRIEESLTSLTRSQWYSTLDFASGYWQVEVAPEDQEKTAFTTPFGLYQFERMPFGLCNAPATFQRLMQRCLGSQVYDHLLIYLDDVIVYSPDFPTHLRHLEQVLSRLQEHSLKLQPRKCRLFQKEVTYLGHIVSNRGVATDPEKTAVVRDWVTPTTVKQVRSFLGYRPGTANQNADVLSRLPGEAPSNTTRVMTCTAPTDSGRDVGSWVKRQGDDPDLRRLQAWRVELEPPAHVDMASISPQLRSLLREWNNFELHNGVLVRHVTELDTGAPVKQVVVPVDQAWSVWEDYHKATGHAHVDKMMSLLRRRFFWVGMSAMARAWTAECATCLVAKPGQQQRAPLCPILSSFPFETVALDFLSLSHPADSYQYNLVITDLFSRYALAVPTKDQTATTTVKALWSALILPFGCPERILTDQGGVPHIGVDQPLAGIGGKPLQKDALGVRLRCA